MQTQEKNHQEINYYLHLTVLVSILLASGCVLEGNKEIIL